MIPLLIFHALFVSDYAHHRQFNKPQVMSTHDYVFTSTRPDSLLSGIQDKVSQAFIHCLAKNKLDDIVELDAKLEKTQARNSNNIVLYWRAYLRYYASIFYLGEHDKKNSENEIDKAILLLKNIKRKNSEEHALLALVQGFAIQFKNANAMSISEEIKKNLKNALTQDSTNLRAYYVFASNDFYTPKQYGGGKQVEKYLLKAIALPTQKIKNEYLPSWGKEESYEMLIKTYIQKKKIDLAKKYYDQGIKEYPKSYLIGQLESQLIKK